MQPNLFFVLGLPKSGTTWLQHLLNSHPNVSCRGEGKFHRFAEALLRMSVEHNEALAVLDKVYGFDFPQFSDQEISELFRVFVILRMRSHPAPGKTDLQWIGEKDPEHAVNAKTMMSLFPGAPFIHLIRDPRDRAISVRFQMQIHKKNVKHYEWSERQLHDAAHWSKTIAAVRENAKGRRYHELRYEDLLDRPHETLAKVFAFLGVDTAPVASCIEAASFEKLSGGRKPGQEDQTSFFRKGIKGDWKNHMDAEQERAFVAAAGGLMAELGYTA